MALKKFFKGKTGVVFWVNVVLMVCLITAVPVVTFYMLDAFTHHGEKIEVPSVVGKSLGDAERMLKERELLAMVSDSTYNKYAAPGAVLEQSPKAGYEVKGGRVIYLTVNQMSEPVVQLPDVVSLGSLREAVSLLESMGFKLTPHQSVMGSPKDLLIGVKQGGRNVTPGQKIPRGRALTLVVGGGEVDTTDVEDELLEEELGTDFDFEL